MKHRKLMSPYYYFHRRWPGKRVTSQRVGWLHIRLSAKGWVSSSPVTTPRKHVRVWIRRTDSRAPLMEMAARNAVIDRQKLADLLGGTDPAILPYYDLTWLGIVAVPVPDNRLRLVGTSPGIARIVNRIFHGRQRRRLTARALIETYWVLNSNGGRATSITEQRLESALNFFEERFELDLSDLIDHAAVRI